MQCLSMVAPQKPLGPADARIRPPTGDLRRLAAVDGLSAETAIDRALGALAAERAEAPDTLRAEIAALLAELVALADHPRALQAPEHRGLFGHLHDLIGLAHFAGREQIRRVVRSTVKLVEELDVAAPRVVEAWDVHVNALLLAALSAAPEGTPLAPTLADDLEAMNLHLAEAHGVSLPFWAQYSRPGPEKDPT